MELKGKTAVITGGASGIGLATAIQFSKAGANIVLGDIEDGPLQTQVEEMRSHGATVIGVHCDVAQEADVVALRDAALNEFGAVHVIFNNAGVAGGATIGTPKKIWDWVMSVNLDGVVNGMNAFIPLFLEQNEGHVVNTASEAGLVGVAGMGPYNASKFAVVGISESLFHELANTGKNVHVSVLCPNFVRTRIFESERNMPKELASYAENPEGAEIKKIAAALVNAGIDAADVAKAVEDAVVNEKFWILTHEHSALRITELRLEWMRGGPSPMAGLVNVNNN
jgi:NAD(P)-dependent dehydrogenase (short-subunit alcohol dehydrogenase family)